MGRKKKQPDAPNDLNPAAFKTIADDLGLPASCAIGQWATLGEKFGTMDADLPWLIGYWLLYGEYHYGERFAHYAERCGKAPATLVRYRWVARIFPPERRIPGLAWGIYAEIGGLERDEQDAVLEKCKNDGWKLPQVQAYRKTLKAIKEGRPLPTEMKCQTCGLTPAELRKQLKTCGTKDPEANE